MGFQMVKIFLTSGDPKRSKVKVNPENIEVQYLETVRDREKVSIEVRYEVIYGLSNGENIFDSRWPLKVKGQGQTLKTDSILIPCDCPGLRFGYR